MNISLLGATGRVGRHLTRMLLDGGHAITVLVRDPIRLGADIRDRVDVVIGDARDLAAVCDVVGDADVTVSTLGGTGLEAPGTMLSEASRNLVTALNETPARDVRIIWVAASGILDASDGRLRNEEPDYPIVFRLLTQEHLRIWTTLRQSGIDWTMVCPPHMPSGEPTGVYRVEADRLPVGGRSIIDADVADFIAREIVQPGFVGRRVGLAE